MHHLTTVCSSSFRKSPPASRKYPKPKDYSPKKNQFKDSQSQIKQEESKTESFCVYCRKKGHLREECYKLKKKEQLQKQPVQRTPQPVAVRYRTIRGIISSHSGFG